VELSESEQLHDLLALGVQLVYTLDSDDKDHLGLWLHEVVACSLSFSFFVDGS